MTDRVSKKKTRKKPCNLTLDEDVKQKALEIARKNKMKNSIVSGVEYAVRQEIKNKKYRED